MIYIDVMSDDLWRILINRRGAITRRLPEGGAARNSLLSIYKRKAKERDLVWGLDDSQFNSLIKGDCHYCDIEPRQICKANGYKSASSIIYNGIDRVDNSRGYEPDNVVSCCKTCNRAKGRMTTEEFLRWARRVVTRYDSRSTGEVVF